MWRAKPFNLDRGIEVARARFGDGPYPLVLHARSLDIDGYSDRITLLSSHADLGEARTALERAFARECAELRDDVSWHDEPPNLVADLDPDHGVILGEQCAITRKDGSGFRAETRVVQLFEIATPPVIGEALFRALRYVDELALCLARDQS